MSHKDAQKIFSAANPIPYCWDIIDYLIHVGADSGACFAKKSLFDQLFVKGRLLLFFVRCLSKFDHGKILEIQVPLSNTGPLSTCYGV